MNSLEPFRPRMVWRTRTVELKGFDFFKILQLYSYSHSITRLKDLLLYLDPELHDVLPIFEDFYREACLLMFKFCDAAHKFLNKNFPKDFAITVMVFVFDEVKGLKEMPTLDASIAEHLQLALKSRLKVLLSRVFDSGGTKAPGWKSTDNLLLGLIDYIEEISSVLPPQYSGCSIGWWAHLRGEVLPHIAAINMDSSSCLLRRPNIIKRYHNDPQMDDCCCGWMTDSIPSGVLAFFAYSAESFARQLHAKEWVKGSSFKARELMNTVFERPSITNANLRKKIAIFREALYWTLDKCFKYSSKLYLHPTVMLPEDKLVDLARTQRQVLLVIILEEAAAINHDFWISRGLDEEEDITCDTERTHKIICDFEDWESNSPPKFDETGFELFMRLINCDFKRWNIVTGMSPDDYSILLEQKLADLET
jgi:hypothetical protein